MSNLEYWLLLAHLRGIGPRTAQKLLSVYKSPKAIFNATDSDLQASGCSQHFIRLIRSATCDQIDISLNWSRQADHTILPISDPSYPQSLRDIPDPPIVLYVWGSPQILSHPAIAVVGSRRATQEGCQIAYTWSKTLANRGFCIVSGLANGIDTLAHKGSLDSNPGETIAVLGSGHQHLYPSQNASLCERIIASGGAVISEFSPDSRAHPGHFPRRNRIISGLAHAVVVIEASVRSGSLITARLAMEHGKEVFALPGSIYNTAVKGCNHLIKQGAHLAENTEDIIEALPLNVKPFRNQTISSRNTEMELPQLPLAAAKIYASLSQQPCSLDQLSLKSGLTAAEVSSILVQLEIKGFIYQSGLGLYARSANTPS